MPFRPAVDRQDLLPRPRGAFIVRGPATAEDRDFILAVCRATMMEYHRRARGWDEAQCEAAFVRHLGLPTTQIVLLAGKPVGILTVVRGPYANAVLSVAQNEISVRQNESTKQLTIIATIFLPLSFVTGFFGQNFGWLVGHIHPLHMGVVIITTLVFGLITPPYGLSLLVASKYVGVGFGRAVVRSLPLYVVFFLTIAFTVLFPDVVLWLPKQFLPESVGCFRSPSGTGYICP